MSEKKYEGKSVEVLRWNAKEKRREKKIGTFVKWGLDSEDSEGSCASFTCIIVSYDDGTFESVYPSNVKIIDSKMDNKDIFNAISIIFDKFSLENICQEDAVQECIDILKIGNPLIDQVIDKFEAKFKEYDKTINENGPRSLTFEEIYAILESFIVPGENKPV